MAPLTAPAVDQAELEGLFMAKVAKDKGCAFKGLILILKTVTRYHFHIAKKGGFT